MSDTAAQPFTFASGRKPSLCSAVTHHTVHTFKTRRYWYKKLIWLVEAMFYYICCFDFAFFIIKAVCFDYN